MGTRDKHVVDPETGFITMPEPRALGKVKETILERVRKEVDERKAKEREGRSVLRDYVLD